MGDIAMVSVYVKELKKCMIKYNFMIQDVLLLGMSLLFTLLMVRVLQWRYVLLSMSRQLKDLLESLWSLQQHKMAQQVRG